MHAKIRRTEKTLRHWQLAHDFAGIPFAIQVRVRLERSVDHFFFDADPPQHLHRIGHHLNARADSRKPRRLLVHAHINADLAQRSGGGHSANARADNGDGKLLNGH